jgi:hypothetical protein
MYSASPERSGTTIFEKKRVKTVPEHSIFFHMLAGGLEKEKRGFVISNSAKKKN